MNTIDPIVIQSAITFFPLLLSNLFHLRVATVYGNPGKKEVGTFISHTRIFFNDMGIIILIMVNNMNENMQFTIQRRTDSFYRCENEQALNC